MPAAASAEPRSASSCSCMTMPPSARALRANSIASIASGKQSNLPRWRRPRPRQWPLSLRVETIRRDDALLIDGAITAAAANNEIVTTIARAGPFGAGNPEPMIALPAHTLVYAEEVGQSHMRARLRAGDGAIINAIAFRAAGQKLGIALARARGQCVHAAGTLCLDRWNGAEQVQLRLVDVAPADGSLGTH